MLNLTLEQAQLFRILAGFFGADRVMPSISVLCVCGGKLPAQLQDRAFGLADGGLEAWARENRCLFTIVDDEGDPHLVIEFCSEMTEVIDIEEIEHRRYLQPILAAQRIAYVTVTQDEFSDLLRPGSDLDIVAFLSDKFGIVTSGPDF